MIRLPPKPRGAGKLWSYLRALHEYIESISPMPSKGTRITRTTIGTFTSTEKTRRGAGTSDGGTPVWQ